MDLIRNAPAKPKPRLLIKQRKAALKEANWRTVSAAVRKRDKGKCRACGKPGTQIHHVVYRSHGGKDEASNLILTCSRCHSAIHAKVTLVTFNLRHPALGITFTRNTQWDQEGKS